MLDLAASGIAIHLILMFLIVVDDYIHRWVQLARLEQDQSIYKHQALDLLCRMTEYGIVNLYCPLLI
jgi:hypothetical protein